MLWYSPLTFILSKLLFWFTINLFWFSFSIGFSSSNELFTGLLKLLYSQYQDKIIDLLKTHLESNNSYRINYLKTTKQEIITYLDKKYAVLEYNQNLFADDSKYSNLNIFEIYKINNNKVYLSDIKEENWDKIKDFLQKEIF